MKYLEMKRAEQRGEHKMMPGVREDQAGGIAGMESSAKASPPAISLANMLGVDLSTVVGTGKGGEILVRDVRSRRQEMDDDAARRNEKADEGIAEQIHSEQHDDSEE